MYHSNKIDFIIQYLETIKDAKHADIVNNSDVHVTVHRDKLPYNKPTRHSNFSDLFWKDTTCFGQFLCPSSRVFYCTHSNGICRTGLLTACKLSANLYDIYHCCVYSEKLLMMDRGTVQNM
jgi:hypothetical protein